MLFPTIEFAVFFLVVLTLSWLFMPYPRIWKVFIIIASFVFYGYADLRFIALLATAIFVNYFGALAIGRTENQRARKTALTLTLIANLGLLAWFKYYGFFVSSFLAAAENFNIAPSIPLLQIILPVGISFFLFQGISYVVDVYRREYPVCGFTNVAIYLSFFPHLVAGPIVRAREFMPQLATPRSPRAIPATPALFLIAGGFAKKILLADLIGLDLVDPVFGSPTAFSSFDVALAILGYSAQIYLDFSGYTDIAIGTAMLLGFWFPQNFNRPYTAASLQDFWRRWHMTLSRWLRDYLYIPLGGNKKGKFRTALNIFITMLLGGLWHGATWNFVLWGGLQGAGLVTERSLTARRLRKGKAPAGAWPKGLSILVVFLFVTFAWVLFRAPDLTTAGAVVSQLWLGIGQPTTLVTFSVLVVVAVGLGLQWIPPRFWQSLQRRYARMPLVVQGVGMGLFVVVVTNLIGQRGVAPFIYFQF